jgi:hypothetical protein
MPFKINPAPWMEGIASAGRMAEALAKAKLDIGELERRRKKDEEEKNAVAAGQDIAREKLDLDRQKVDDERAESAREASADKYQQDTAFAREVLQTFGDLPDLPESLSRKWGESIGEATRLMKDMDPLGRTLELARMRQGLDADKAQYRREQLASNVTKLMQPTAEGAQPAVDQETGTRLIEMLEGPTAVDRRGRQRPSTEVVQEAVDDLLDARAKENATLMRQQEEGQRMMEQAVALQQMGGPLAAAGNFDRFAVAHQRFLMTPFSSPEEVTRGAQDVYNELLPAPSTKAAPLGADKTKASWDAYDAGIKVLEKLYPEKLVPDSTGFYKPSGRPSAFYDEAAKLAASLGLPAPLDPNKETAPAPPEASGSKPVSLSNDQIAAAVDAYKKTVDIDAVTKALGLGENEMLDPESEKRLLEALKGVDQAEIERRFDEYMRGVERAEAEAEDERHRFLGLIGAPLDEEDEAARKTNNQGANQPPKKVTPDRTSPPRWHSNFAARRHVER